MVLPYKQTHRTVEQNGKSRNKICMSTIKLRDKGGKNFSEQRRISLIHVHNVMFPHAELRNKIS